MSLSAQKLSLPPLAPTSGELMMRLSQENVSLPELVELIHVDAVLSSKLLKVANAPFYGVSGRIATLEDALMVVGTSASRHYVLSDLLVNYFSQDPWCKMRLEPFWERSLCTGVSAHLLASRVGAAPSKAFMMGLLQRIGVLSLVALLGECYLTIFEGDSSGEMLASVEREYFATDHAESGGELLKSWALPEEISAAVRYQYDSQAPAYGELPCQILRAATWLTEAKISQTPANLTSLPDDLIHRFEFDPETVPVLLDQVTKGCARYMAMIKGS